MSTTPILRFPVPDAPYILDTDASLTGTGAVLSQLVDGQERVLGYASRTLSKAERNYCVTRRELLAVVQFVKYFRPYLYGQKFTIRTDHSSLQWLLNFREPEGQVARWIESLSEYTYEIIHRPGVRHGNADGLSRRPCKKNCCSEARSTIADVKNDDKRICEGDPAHDGVRKAVNLVALQPVWTNKTFGESQRADRDLALVLHAVENQQKPLPEEASGWPQAARRYLIDWDRLKLEDGVLRRKWYTAQGQESHDQFIVPRELVPEVLRMAHDNPLAGHFGEKRTKLRAQSRFYWVNMSRDIRDWYTTCTTCCGRRPPPTVPHHPVQRQLVTAPLQRVAIDILGPLNPRTKRGNLYVLVMVDYFTKWLEVAPMTDMKAETVARKFMNRWVYHWRIPQQLHSDQGTQFESDLFKDLCKRLMINKSHTTPLHPQSDGQTERANRTLLDVVSKLCAEHPGDWDNHLKVAQAAYNSSVHRVTRQTPNSLMLGREVTTPLTLLAPPPPDDLQDEPWIIQMRKQIRDTYDLVADTTRLSHRADTPYTDRRQKGYVFSENDLVWLYESKARKGVTKKLDAKRWTGPWRIVRVVSTCVYAIKNISTGTSRVVNVDRLAPYRQRQPEQFHVAPDMPLESEADNEFQEENGLEASPDLQMTEEEALGTSPAKESGVENETTPDVIAHETVVMPAPLRVRRNQRARRPPAWTQVFDLSWAE